MMTDERPRMLCESCGSAMTPIAYGYPGADMWEAAEQGDIVLGGCCVSPGQPLWSCRHCGAERGGLDMRIWADSEDEA